MTITVTHNGTDIPMAPPKDPDSVVDYGFEWADWLSSGEVILTSIWLLETDIIESSNSFTDTQTSVFISGGDAGNVYTITNRISTATRVEDRSMNIPVREK